MNLKPLSLVLILAGATLILDNKTAWAQTTDSHHGIHKTLQNSDRPVLLGQDAFAAIGEIIALLQADPMTDWSQIKIATLREHLVDMNRLVLDAKVVETPIDRGLEMTINGQGRTLQAIQNMVPAHASMLNDLNNWIATAERTTTGAKLTVTSQNTKDVAHIRGLGFFGLMVSGSHHQIHHLGLAHGKDVHAQ
jgi:hypothetical protein